MSEALNPVSVKALVVDDSAVARKVLTSILHREGIEVDIAVSAEDALEFLISHTPDVIFMDHTMPGMSGFEALKAIKANPRTATIPVMMFTSQSGDVYLTQARALGAIDVLQKDSLADIDLSGRLRELGIFRQQVRARKANMELVDNKNSARQRQLATLIRLLVREEFARFKDEFPALLKQQQQQQQELLAKDQEISEEEDLQTWQQEPPKQSSLFGGLGGWLIMGLLGILLIGWLMLQTTKQNTTGEPGIELVTSPNTDSARKPETAISSSISLPETVPRNPVSPKLLDIISWSIGDQLTYGPTEAALAGDRFNRIQTLLTMLADAKFQGTLQLTVHQGQFCVITNSSGELTLAKTNTPAAQCGLLAGDIDTTNSRLMSLPFAMFLDNSPVANGEQGILVNIVSASDKQPIIRYPQRDNGTLAGDWNKIAQQNNRIAIKLVPENPENTLN